MSRRLLIVTDASPLITLAAGDALDCLAMPRTRVLIPDMVYAEVTENLARLGARDIVEWVRRHMPVVAIAPTTVFAEYQILRSINPHTRSRGRGEASAMETLQAAYEADPDASAILLFEDNDIRRRSFLRGFPEGLAALSTGDLLRELEAARLIQSADHVLDLAAARDRNVESLRRPMDDGGRAVLRAHFSDDEKAD